jgi:tryptophan synthase beta chain
VLQDAAGNIELTHSVSAGLDYAAVGPEHAALRESGRVEFAYATDAAALEAFQLIAKTEGILPALESSHAIAGLKALAPTLGKDALVLVNLSGRGDKDVHLVAPLVGGVAAGTLAAATSAVTTGLSGGTPAGAPVSTPAGSTGGGTR